MKKSTISISQLTQEILWNKKINTLLESIAGNASAANSALMSLGKELKQSGLDPTDEEVQAALLMKAIQTKGKLDKIEPEDVKELEAQIKEGRSYLAESESMAVLAIEAIGMALGNAALLHAITHGIEKITGKKVNEAQLKANIEKKLQLLKKVTGYPAKVMETFFKFVAKTWGGGELAQKVAGVMGTMFVVAALFAIGVAFFPGTASIIMFTLSIMSFIGKTYEIINLLKHLWHIIKHNQTEVEKKDAAAIEQAIDAEWRGSPGEKAMGDMSRNAIMRK